MFAAASLTDAVSEVGRAFARDTGHRVDFSFGASSDLARQIRAGAPADVFFSADERQMEALEGERLVDPRDRLTPLSNALVIVVPASDRRSLAGPEELLGVSRLAVADPEIVPAGVYARRYLEARGLWRRLAPRVVPTLDVRAALAAVEAEHAPAGIVYRTDAAIADRVRVAFEVPRSEGPRIVYALAPVAASANRAPVRELVRHLVSPAAMEVYTRLGFVPLAGR